MKLITKADVLRTVPEKWNAQYDPRYKGTDKDEIYKKLLKLVGSGVYPERQIDNIIGNDSWTELTCGECERHVEAVVHLGEEPGYESNTFYLCAPCLKKALAQMGIA